MIKFLLVLHKMVVLFLRATTIFTLFIALCLLCSGVCQGIPEFYFASKEKEWPTCGERNKYLFIFDQLFKFIFDQPAISQLPFSNGMHRVIVGFLCVLQCGLLRAVQRVVRKCSWGRVAGSEMDEPDQANNAASDIYDLKEHIDKLHKSLKDQKEQTIDLLETTAEAFRWAQTQIEIMEERNSEYVETGETQQKLNDLCDKFPKMRERDAETLKRMNKIMEFNGPESVIGKGAVKIDGVMQDWKNKLQSHLDKDIKKDKDEDKLKNAKKHFGENSFSQENDQAEESVILELIATYAKRSNDQSQLFFEEAVEVSKIVVGGEQKEAERKRMLEDIFSTIDPSNAKKRSLIKNLKRGDWMNLYDILSQKEKDLSTSLKRGKKIAACGGAFGSALFLVAIYFMGKIPHQVMDALENQLPTSWDKSTKGLIILAMAVIIGTILGWFTGGKKGGETDTVFEQLSCLMHGASAPIALSVTLMKAIHSLA